MKQNSAASHNRVFSSAHQKRKVLLGCDYKKYSQHIYRCNSCPLFHFPLGLWSKFLYSVMMAPVRTPFLNPVKSFKNHRNSEFVGSVFDKKHKHQFSPIPFELQKIMVIQMITITVVCLQDNQRMVKGKYFVIFP